MGGPIFFLQTLPNAQIKTISMFRSLNYQIQYLLHSFCWCWLLLLLFVIQSIFNYKIHILSHWNQTSIVPDFNSTKDQSMKKRKKKHVRPRTRALTYEYSNMQMGGRLFFFSFGQIKNRLCKNDCVLVYNSLLQYIKKNVQ